MNQSFWPIIYIWMRPQMLFFKKSKYGLKQTTVPVCLLLTKVKVLLHTIKSERQLRNGIISRLIRFFFSRISIAKSEKPAISLHSLQKEIIVIKIIFFSNIEKIRSINSKSWLNFLQNNTCNLHLSLKNGIQSCIPHECALCYHLLTLILEGNASLVMKAKYYPRVELAKFKVIIVGNLYFQ